MAEKIFLVVFASVIAKTTTVLFLYPGSNPVIGTVIAGIIFGAIYSPRMEKIQTALLCGVGAIAGSTIADWLFAIF